MRRLAALALLLAAAAPAVAATATGSADGQMKVGVVITGAQGRVGTAAPSAARSTQTLAPRITRESEDGQAFTLIYY